MCVSFNTPWLDAIARKSPSFSLGIVWFACCQLGLLFIQSLWAFAKRALKSSDATVETSFPCSFTCKIVLVSEVVGKFVQVVGVPEALDDT